MFDFQKIEDAAKSLRKEVPAEIAFVIEGSKQIQVMVLGYQIDIITLTIGIVMAIIWACRQVSRNETRPIVIMLGFAASVLFVATASKDALTAVARLRFENFDFEVGPWLMLSLVIFYVVSMLDKGNAEPGSNK